MRVVVSGTYSSVRDFPTLLMTQLENIGMNPILVTHDFKNLWNKFTVVLRCEIIHVVSIKPCSFEGIFWILCFIFLRAIGKKLIIHWIGTDVLDLTPFFASCISRLGNLHLSQAPWLVDELEEKGLNSIWFPILPPLDIQCEPLPKKLTILSYFGSKSRHDFYGKKKIEQLANKYPNLNFLIVGEVNEENKLVIPNMNYLGFIDNKNMGGIYDHSTVLLRLTEHDGLSLMVLEALSHGRYVIWTKNFPHCLMANNVSEVEEYLEELKQERNVNICGLDFIKNFYDGRWARKLSSIYKTVATKQC